MYVCVLDSLRDLFISSFRTRSCATAVLGSPGETLLWLLLVVVPLDTSVSGFGVIVLISGFVFTGWVFSVSVGCVLPVLHACSAGVFMGMLAGVEGWGKEGLGMVCGIPRRRGPGGGN